MCWVLKICSIFMFEQFWKRAGITPTSCVLPCERGSFASDAAYESTAEERLRRKETQVNHVGTEAHLSVPDAQSHTQSHPCSIDKENALLCFVPKLSNTFCSFQRLTLSFASGYYSFVARACKMPYWTLCVRAGWRQFPELYTHTTERRYTAGRNKFFPKNQISRFVSFLVILVLLFQRLRNFLSTGASFISSLFILQQSFFSSCF